jgi:hypothetical protein
LDGDSPILDFVSKTPPFRALSISPRELALLEKALHLSLFINGWNEVGCDEFRATATRFKQLDPDCSGVSIILATPVHQPSALPNMSQRVSSCT